MKKFDVVAWVATAGLFVGLIQSSRGDQPTYPTLVECVSEDATVWKAAERAGIVRRQGSRIALTPEGRLVSNELFREIIGFLDSGGEA